MNCQSLVEIVLRNAAEQPNETAVSVHTGGGFSTITHGDLLSDARRCAARLVAEGVRIDDQIAILIPHCAQQYAIYLGAMMVGAQPSFHTPFNIKSDPALYWPSQDALLHAISPKLVITDPVGKQLIVQNLPSLPFAVVETSEVMDSPPLAIEDFRHSEFALVQYSSGTTGPRKAVQLTHEAILQQAQSYAKAIGLSANDRIVSWLPLYHDMGLMTSFIMPLVNRTPVASMSAFEWVARPERILELLIGFRGTLCWMPNFAFSHLASTVSDASKYDLSGIRALINCSEPCRGRTFAEFHRTFERSGLRREALQTCYAMAETVFAVTQSDLCSSWQVLGEFGNDIGGADILGSGTPIEGIELRILDDETGSASDGEIGEIAIRSNMCIERYRGRSEAAIDHDGWYRTGDLGIMVGGQLFVIGRKDDVIVSRGKKIFAHEVEMSLREVAGLKPGRSAVLGAESVDGSTLDLVVVCEVEDNADTRQIRRTVSRTIEYRFGIAPNAVHIVENGWIVKSSSGKISRYANVRKLEHLRQAS